MVQFPAFLILTVVPLVPLQLATVVSELLNITGFPDAPPIPETVKGASPYVFAAIASKVTSCGRQYSPTPKLLKLLNGLAFVKYGLE